MIKTRIVKSDDANNTEKLTTVTGKVKNKAYKAQSPCKGAVRLSENNAIVPIKT